MLDYVLWLRKQLQVLRHQALRKWNKNLLKVNKKTSWVTMQMLLLWLNGQHIANLARASVFIIEFEYVFK